MTCHSPYGLVDVHGDWAVYRTGQLVSPYRVRHLDGRSWLFDHPFAAQKFARDKHRIDRLKGVSK